MNEIELAIEKANALFSESTNYLLDHAEAIESIAKVKKGGVSRGLMLSFESKRYDDQEALGMPLESFTPNYSMTNVEYAVEGFKDRALKAFRKAKEYAHKAIKAIYDAIMKLIGKYKRKESDIDDDAEISKITVIKMLKEEASKNMLNSWVVSDFKNGSLLYLIIDRMSQDVKFIADTYEVILASITAVADKGVINDISFGSTDAVHFDDTFGRAGKLVEECSKHLDVSNYSKGSSIMSLLNDEGVSKLRRLEDDKPIYGYLSDVVDAAALTPSKEEVSIDSYDHIMIMDNSEKAKENFDKLNETLKDAKDKVVSKEEKDAISQAYTAAKNLNDDLNGLEQYALKLTELSKAFDSVRKKNLYSLKQASDVAVIFDSTLAAFSDIIKHYSPEINKT